jgi:hypothetical protein
MPQWEPLVWVSTQASLQAVCAPQSSTQLPPVQVRPAPQALPQRPQCALSLLRFTQAPLQARSGGHTHAPPWHSLPSSHVASSSTVALQLLSSPSHSSVAPEDVTGHWHSRPAPGSAPQVHESGHEVESAQDSVQRPLSSHSWLSHSELRAQGEPVAPGRGPTNPEELPPLVLPPPPPLDSPPLSRLVHPPAP